MNILTQKLKEALFSVAPIILIVLILHFFVSPLETPELVRFLIGAVFIIIGLALFLFGVEIGIDPIGKLMGSAIVKSNKVWIVIASGLLLGFFISIAEPDLHILAEQVDSVSGGLISFISIVVVVSIGIAVLLAVGFFRIIFNFHLNKILTGVYIIILILAFFTPSEYLAISFDASGATTGALTVPFILALAVGVSALKKDSKASEKDSFGLVAIASSGAIISVMVMSIFSKAQHITGHAEEASTAATGVFIPFLQYVPVIALETLLALSPIAVIFVVFQFITFKLPRRRLRKLVFGLIYSFIGLVIFLTGVNAGFLQVGVNMGYGVAMIGSTPLLIIVGFFLGFFTVLAEPAVHALTDQIQTVTSGYVKKRTVLAALTIGIGVAVALSMIRILVPGLKLWHYLLPGYAISIAMTYFVPKLFVGIAFDSGGVASGPMTATFILAFTRGAASAIEGADVLLDGFGVIAMVAMTPLITLQILGIIYRIKSRKGGLEEREPN